jgi:2-hydroxychromene-2-carboxylate isomerase
MTSIPNSIGTIMDKANTILVYSDYKGPYAFLAKDLTYKLDDQFDVHIERLPYTIDIPSYLGSARLDERGEVIESQSKRPPVVSSALLVHGLPATSTQARTRNSWNAQNMGFLSRRDWYVVAKRQGKRQFRAYHDRVFERFWRRELDIEDPEAIAAVLSEVHADRTGFRSYLDGTGRIEHDTVPESAEAAGVFGVPSLIVDGELFWGREHLSDIPEKLAPLARSNRPDPVLSASSMETM